MARTTLHCGRCGSEQVFAAATVVWQPEKQEWNLAPRQYWMTCFNCNCGCLAEYLDIVEKPDLTSDQLYNCCTGHAEPDWSVFDALGIGPMILLRDSDGEVSGETEAASDPVEANFWTVYGHRPEGDCEPITDLKSRLQAEIVATQLAEISGLAVSLGAFGHMPPTREQ